MSKDEFRPKNPIDTVCHFELLREIIQEAIEAASGMQDELSDLNRQTVIQSSIGIKEDISKFIETL